MLQQFVRVFVDEDDELLGRRETVENPDATACGCPERATQIIGGFDGDAAFDDRRAQRRRLAAGIARRFRVVGERLAIGLREVLSRDSAKRPGSRSLLP